MWKCSACGYVNEQWDENCLRCGAVMQPGTPEFVPPPLPPELQADSPPETQAVPDARAQQPAAAPFTPPAVILPPPQPTSAAAPRPADRAAMVIILLSLAGLIAIGVLAWQQGKLDGLGFLPRRSADRLPAVEGQPQAAADPFSELKSLRVRNFKHFRPYIEILEESEVELNSMVITDSSPGQLSAESLAILDRLQQLGDEIAAQYREFEGKAAKYSSAELQAPQQLIREEFRLRFEQFLQMLGTAYAIDGQGVHAAYLHSDKVPALLGELRMIDPAGAQEKWAQALHNREQYRLDQDYEDIYRQLTIRYDTLVAMHRQMDEAIKAIPAEKSRSGSLDKNSNDLLTLYNEIMVKVEESVVEYEEYLASLGSLERSDRMKAHIEEFTKLAQDDHLFAFTETYKIYEGDRRLEHPSYTWLELHFEFARNHWPEIAQSYRDIYAYYEDRWEKFWASEEGSP